MGGAGVGVARSLRSLQGAGADSSSADASLTRIFNHEACRGYSTRLPLIHGQELAMQFFPRDGHCLARLQVFDSTRHFHIPSLVNKDRFIRTVKSVEQRVG